MKYFKLIKCYLLFLLFRDMDNHIVQKEAIEMHQYLTEVYRNKVSNLLQMMHNKMFK